MTYSGAKLPPPPPCRTGQPLLLWGAEPVCGGLEWLVRIGGMTWKKYKCEGGKFSLHHHFLLPLSFSHHSLFFAVYGYAGTENRTIHNRDFPVPLSTLPPHCHHTATTLPPPPPPCRRTAAAPPPRSSRSYSHLSSGICRTAFHLILLSHLVMPCSSNATGGYGVPGWPKNS